MMFMIWLVILLRGVGSLFHDLASIERIFHDLANMERIFHDLASRILKMLVH